MPEPQEAPPPGGGPAAFAYDYNTLWDMVERLADWGIGLRLAEGSYRIQAINGEGIAEAEPVDGTDFDTSATRIGRKLRKRGVLP